MTERMRWPMGPRGEIAMMEIANLWNERRHPGRRKEDRMGSERQRDDDKGPERLVGGVNVVADTVNIYVGDEISRSVLPDGEGLQAALPLLRRLLHVLEGGEKE